MAIRLKQDLIDENEALRRERDLLNLALRASLKGELEPLATIDDNGGSVNALTWGLQRSHGGILVLQYLASECNLVLWVEDWLARWNEIGPCHWRTTFTPVAEALTLSRRGWGLRSVNRDCDRE